MTDHVGSPDTEGDGQLVRRDDGTANRLGDTLGLVHGDGGRESADTKTSNETAHGELDPDRAARNLDDDTNDVEESGRGDSVATTNGVRERCRNQTSDQSTSTQKTNNRALSHGAKGAILSETFQEIRHCKETCMRLLARLNL